MRASQATPRGHHLTAPAIRAGLSVQELKAMTAMRVGSNTIEPTPSYAKPQTTTSSYQTATPQQLRAAGIQAVVQPNNRPLSSRRNFDQQQQQQQLAQQQQQLAQQIAQQQKQQKYGATVITPRGYNNSYQPENPCYASGYEFRHRGGAYIDTSSAPYQPNRSVGAAPNYPAAATAQPPKTVNAHGKGASIEDLKELTRIRLMKEREAQREHSLASGLPGNTGRNSLSSYATANSAGTAVVNCDGAFMHSHSGSTPPTPRSEVPATSSSPPGRGIIPPLSASPSLAAVAPGVGSAMSTPRYCHPSVQGASGAHAYGAANVNSGDAYGHYSIAGGIQQQNSQIYPQQKQRYQSERSLYQVFPAELSGLTNPGADASSGWPQDANRRDSDSTASGPIWDPAMSNSFDPATGETTSSHSNVFAGIRRSNSSRTFGPEDGASTEAFARDALIPSNRTGSFDLNGISTEALIHGHAPSIPLPYGGDSLSPSRYDGRDERFDASSDGFDGIAGTDYGRGTRADPYGRSPSKLGMLGKALSYSALQTDTDNAGHTQTAFAPLPPLDSSPTKPRIGAFMDSRVGAGAGIGFDLRAHRASPGPEAHAGPSGSAPRTLKPIPPRLAFASSPSTLPGVPGQGAGVNMEGSPIPKLRSRQNSGTSLGRQESADLNLLASEVAELVLDHTPLSTPVGGGSHSKFHRQHSGNLQLGGQAALMPLSPDGAKIRGHGVCEPVFEGELSLSDSPSVASSRFTPGSQVPGQSRFFPDT